jgi:hypothetical protein
MKTETELQYGSYTAFLLTITMALIAYIGPSLAKHRTHALNPVTNAKLELIRVSKDGTQFVSAESGKRFIAWGFNYDHDHAGRLLEDYWYKEWATVVEDFNEMKDLGVNVVRIHLQLARFMTAADIPNQEALGQLGQLLALAEKTGLYLDLTGLACYHKQDVPAWYDGLKEHERWVVQTRFWEAIAKTCAKSNAVFCYDLMNEPILPGENKKEKKWLAGEFGGKYFVQRITLDLAGRTRQQVAKAWINTLVAAIRQHDSRHMVTVGVIPWAHTFPKAKPIFYSEAVGKNLDFVSVHFYPKKGEVDRALTALQAYRVGKPVVIEETSPLWCSEKEFDAFVDGSRAKVDGYIGFYWGKTIKEYSQPDTDMAGSIMRNWLKYFRAKGPEILK